MKERRIPQVKRRRQLREPKRRFTLFCEGKNTEPAYFDAIKRIRTGALIDVETRRGVGAPMTIARESVRFARSIGLSERSRRRENSFEEKDEVWAVFDRDNHSNFDEAVCYCESHGVRVARSNPCFELWLILHDSDYDRPDDCRAVQKKLKSLRPEYDDHKGKTPDCRDLVTRVEEAEKRGDILVARREREGDPHGNPSTTVGKLTASVRSADKLSKGSK